MRPLAWERVPHDDRSSGSCPALDLADFKKQLDQGVAVKITLPGQA